MAAIETVDARRSLWEDDRLYRPRYEKTATALIAVQRTLQKRRPLQGAEDEFLALYAVLEAADPDIFTLIWEDPFSYFWARRAYELVGLCLKPAKVPNELRRYCLALGADEPREALRLHLERFKTFIIALEILTGGTHRFARSLEATLPLSIPATPYSILGDGRIEIAAVSANALEIVDRGKTLLLRPEASTLEAHTPRMVRRPIVEHGGVAVTLKPETFHLPGITQAEALRATPAEFQEQQIPLLRQALELIAKHQPDTLRKFGDLIKVIGLKPPTTETTPMSASPIFPARSSSVPFRIPTGLPIH